MPTNAYLSNPREMSLGRYIHIPPSPLEIAMKQAKLAALQQEPRLRERELQLQTEDRARMLEALRQQGELGYAQLAEEREYHRGSLEQAMEALNQRKEETQGATRGNIVEALLTNVLPEERAGTLPKGTVAAAIKKMGFPELAGAGEEAAKTNLDARVSELLPQTTAATGTARDKLLATYPEDVRAGVTARLPQTNTTQPAGSESVSAGTRTGQLLKLLGISASPYGVVGATNYPAAKYIAKNAGPFFGDVTNELLGRRKKAMRAVGY